MSLTARWLVTHHFSAIDVEEHAQYTTVHLFSRFRNITVLEAGTTDGGERGVGERGAFL